MRSSLIGCVSVLCSIAQPASGQIAPDLLKARSVELNVLEEQYGACVLGHIQSGTKIDLEDAVLSTAVKECEALKERAQAKMLSMMLLSQRVQLKRDWQAASAAHPERVRQSAAFGAVAAYFKNNAGGRPADSTARSK